MQRARSEIQQAFPELGARAVTFLGAGVDSEAYLVDGSWVFRFPKREAVARALRREVALLPKLAGRLPVATPQFAYLGHQTTNGLLFAGYRLIPGEPLTPDLFAALPVHHQDGVLATLAAFLDGVHTFPVAEAAACGVETLSVRAWVEAAWSVGRTAVLPLLDADDRLALAASIERFLEDEQNVATMPCLLYADFAPEHILYDAAANAITGIIDWGDLSIGDPDFDLLYLYQDYGPNLVRRLLAYLPHPEPARLMNKLRVFNACDHLNTIADPARHQAEDADVHESVAALREILRPVRVRAEHDQPGPPGNTP